MSDLALKLVEECIKRKDPYLELGNCGLTDKDFIEDGALDKALRQCRHLKNLILSDKWHEKEDELDSRNSLGPNIINKIPPAIIELKELRTLIICGTSRIKFGIRNMSVVTHLFNLKWLDISYSEITSICDLKNLQHLQILRIINNKIRVIKGLEHLSQLQELVLCGNQITEITGLENLSCLSKLNLYNNKITEIRGLENLSKLRFLRLSRNLLTSIKGLGNLSALQILDINHNRINSIGGLEKLSHLLTLDVSNNQIKKIGGLDKVAQLQNLDIHANRITTISGLENLCGLQRLNLLNNKIADIKPLIPFLEKKKPLNIVYKDSHEIEINEISIANNPLTSPPEEIAKQGNEAILNYFAELEKRGIDYLYEAKMLIIGQPRAGKTSLRYKLFDVKADLPTEDKTTRGIDIQRLDFDITDKEGKQRKFYYNVWDFGGQQIYQTTHQFFLTRRSLYVLVMDTGKDSTGNDDTTINYWLQAVELLGGNSPLLLVRNEKNERKVTIDLSQKRGRFSFLKDDYGIDLNTLIPGTPTFSDEKLKDFNHLKDDIKNELSHIPLVGFPMPKNWVLIRNELQDIALHNHYITKKDFTELCKKHDVIDYDRQMELSRIFHDLGIFLHFQDYGALDDFIILQNTWATDAVFAVFDNAKVQNDKGRFTDADLAEIWKDKDYEPDVHKKLLTLMRQFELCYLVDQSKPNIYIIPEMLADTAPIGYKWQVNNDLPLQYHYDFMPKGILTRLIVRMHRNIARHDDKQCVWKTGVKIEGASLGYLNTIAEITEAWDNKKLNIRVQGSFMKELLSVLAFQIDTLNNEYFSQVENSKEPQKSRWYKMIPCICLTCQDSADKHFYDYQKLLEMKEFGVPSIRCEKRPYAEVSIPALIDGVFAEIKEKVGKKERDTNKQTIKIFLASSSELKEEREQFEIFIGRENKQLNEKGVFLRLEIWEDFLDAVSQDRLQEEYNQVIEGCDIFVTLFFTKVGKYTAEEFERAFKQFKATDNPKIFTYFKEGDIKSTKINKEDTISLFNFQEKLNDLGHFYTTFENDAQLHLHFKKQLERLYGW